MVKRSAEFTVRRGNCAMTFDFGPENAFAFSTNDAKVSIPVSCASALSNNLVLESAPTIRWNEESGEVTIRDSLRVVDNSNRPLVIALYVARVLQLKVGQYIFEEPWNGPGPDDLTIQFPRPHDATWTAPVVEVEGLPAWTS